MKRTFTLLLVLSMLMSGIIVPRVMETEERAEIIIDRNLNAHNIEIGQEVGAASMTDTPEPVRSNEEAGWFQSTEEEFAESTLSSVTVMGHGTDARVNLTGIKSSGWTEILPPVKPRARYGHRMVYDTAEKKTILFGGRTNNGQSSSETWLFDGRTNLWTKAQPPSSPPVRYFHAMTYDEKNNKTVLFGGYWVAPETWLYDARDDLWTRQYPERSPPRLYGHSMVYDSTNEKTVLFGGRTYSGGWILKNETWVYDVTGNTWTKMSPPVSPAVRYHHDMVYDPVNNRVVMFGGIAGAAYRDTWLYDVANDLWTQIFPTVRPSARYYLGMVYDHEDHTTVLYGGYPYDLHVWLLDISANTWVRRTYVERPPQRYAFDMAYDADNRKVIMFGGYSGYKDDTWVYDQYRYAASGTLTSPLITLPENAYWDRLSVEKTEVPYTFVNITIINALSSTPVAGFADLSIFHMNISALNEMGISRIRLRASFTGTGATTPSLNYWGLQWNRDKQWNDAFIGDHKIRTTPDADNDTSALWGFDEGKGQILLDSSVNGNDGLLGGGGNSEPSDPSWRAGKFGKALHFDGRDDYIWVEKTDSLKPDDSISIEAWFQVDSMQKDAALFGGRENGDYAVQILKNRTLRVLLSTINLEPNQYNTLYSSSLLIPYKWYHVVLFFERPNMVLYLDGREEARLTVDFPIRHSNVPLFVGAEVGSSFFPYTPTRYFHGAIDLIRITRIPRDPHDIFFDARGGLSLKSGNARIMANSPSPSAETVLLYNLDEQMGHVIRDRSRNNIYGLLRGDRRSTSGLFGTAMEFNGSGPSIEVRDSNQLHLTEATYEFRVKRHQQGTPGILFLEYDETGVINEAGYVDPSGTVRYVFDNGTSKIETAVGIPENQWVHIAFTRSGSLASIYVDGSLKKSGSISGFNPYCNQALFLGGNGTGMNGFNGLLDEIMISNKALSQKSLLEHASLFLTEAAFRSKDITLPIFGQSSRSGGIPDYVWNSLMVNSNVPDNSFLNISIHDNRTGELLMNISPNSSSVMQDLMRINVHKHPGIYLEAHLSGPGTASPIIYDWNINWSDVESPKLINTISESFFLNEDTPEPSIVDVSPYFYDAYSQIMKSNYSVSSTPDEAEVNFSFNSSVLGIVSLKENWTGTLLVVVNCTNLYGQSISSNQFEIIVANVDDGPIWYNTPPSIQIAEDENATYESFFSKYVFDVEENLLLYSVTSDNENISVELLEPDTLLIEGGKDYYGSGNITATVFEKSMPSLKSSITIPVTVSPVNDPPLTELITPYKHSMHTSTEVEFVWEVYDVDSEPGDIFYDFYLSKTFPVLLYLSDMTNTSVNVKDLDDDSTYFWKVVPKDASEVGLCSNGTWSFNINTTVLFPETNMLAPLNGSILNVTSANLTWEGINPTKDDILYDVYFGETPGNLTKVNMTEKTWILMDGLKDNTTYYWKVVPVTRLLEGLCNSGIWWFRINTSFVAIYGLKVDIDTRLINITQGENASFNITLANLGNLPIMVQFKPLGYLASYVNLPEETFLPAGTHLTVKGVISGTLILAPNKYNIKVRISYPGGMKEITTEVVISSLSSNELGAEELTSQPQVLWLWITVAALGLVVLGFIIFIVRKRRVEERDRKRQLELDLLEAEIIPPPPPPLPPMQNFQALPQYAGNFGYRQEKPQLARQSYAPPDQAEPKQLSATAGVRPSPSAEYIPPPPAVDGAAPAPSVVLPNLDGERVPPPPMKALPPAPSSAVQVPRIYAPPPAAPTPPLPKEEPAPEVPPSTKPSNKKYSFSRSSGKRAPPLVGTPSGPKPGGKKDEKTSVPTVDTPPGGPISSVKNVGTPPPVVGTPSGSPSSEMKKVNTPPPVVDIPSSVPSSGKKDVDTSSTGEENTLDALSRLLGDMPATLPKENTGKSASNEGK